MSRCVILVVCLFICILICLVLILKSKGIKVSRDICDYKRIIEEKEREYYKLKSYIQYANTELLDREQEIIDLKSGIDVKAKNLDNGGGPSRLNETVNGYINKKYDNKDRYDIEKR